MLAPQMSYDEHKNTKRKNIQLFLLIIFSGIFVSLLTIHHFTNKESNVQKSQKKFQTKLVQTGILPWQRKELKHLLTREQVFISNIEKNPSLAVNNLEQTINQMNQYLLKNYGFLDNYYKNKYPNITKQLKDTSNKLIKLKTRIIIETFWNTNKNLLTDFNKKNKELITNFHTNLTTYLKNVKKTNGEFFINYLLSYKNFIKYIKSKDKNAFLEELYKSHFLSESMLRDAIQTFIKQYEDGIYTNQAIFLNQTIKNFTEYLNSINDIIFIPDLSEISKETQISIHQLSIKNLIFIDEETINKLNSIVKKILAAEGIDTILTFTPLSLLADGSTLLYEKKLHTELDKIIDDAVNNQEEYIWTILNYRLNKIAQTFTNKTLQSTIKILSKQYEITNKYSFIGERK